jgi:PAS domain-containing protein
MANESNNDPALLRRFLDAIPSFVLVVDEDVRILDYNAAATGLLGASQKEVLRRRSGEVLNCLHSTDAPGGCGQGEFCKTCIIRTAVNDAFSGQTCVRHRAKMQLLSNGKAADVFMLVTASPFSHEQRKMVLLVLEDISELVELQHIVPICMYCKRVREDDQYWTQVEAYFNRKWDVRFSHGLCPDCQKIEMEKLQHDFGLTP